MPILKGEFDKVANWTAELPTGTSLRVSLRPIEATEDLILHPLGVLKVNQRAIPLDLDLDKVGNQRPTDAKRITIELPDDGLDKHADAKESFATSQFKNLSDAAKLSSPAYEKQNSGVELAMSDRTIASHSARQARGALRGDHHRQQLQGPRAALRRLCALAVHPLPGRQCRQPLAAVGGDEAAEGAGRSEDRDHGADLRRRLQRRQHGARRDGDVHEPRRRPGLPRRRDPALARAGGDAARDPGDGGGRHE